LPPVNAFWSVTMYELPASLLNPNPISRYLINSTMLEDLKRDSDGGITLYIQSDSPGKDLGSNWLPATEGPVLGGDAPLLAERRSTEWHVAATTDHTCGRWGIGHCSRRDRPW
jgi:hypothetical protein